MLGRSRRRAAPLSDLADAERAELHVALQALADELREALDESEEAARPVALDQQAIGRVSRIDAIQQQKMLEATRSAQRVRLQQVRAALVRVSEGEFGDCLECGEGVGYARLKVRPESALCIECQRTRERR